MTTYEANPATDTARYTFTRKRGDVLELVALYSNPEDHRDTRNVVVGTTTEAPVKMFVGRGAMIHDGTQYTHTITVDHKVSRGGDGDPRRANLHRAGDVLVTEPYNCCGAQRHAEVLRLRPQHQPRGPRRRRRDVFQVPEAGSQARLTPTRTPPGLKLGGCSAPCRVCPAQRCNWVAYRVAFNIF